MKRFIVLFLCFILPLTAYGFTRLNPRLFGVFTSSGPTITWQHIDDAENLILNFVASDGCDTAWVRIFGKTFATDTGWHIDADNDTTKFVAAPGDSGFTIVIPHPTPYTGVKVDNLPRGTLTCKFTLER